MANEVVGYLGAIYLQDADNSIVFTDEATTSSGGYTIYTITNALKRFFDDASSIVVKKNGVAITTGFTIQHCGGKITFTNALLNTDVITVSGKYFSVAEAGGFYKYTINIERNEVDTSTFGNDFAQKLTVQGSFSATAEKFYYDEAYFNKLGDKGVFVFYVNENSNDRYEGYGYIKKDDITVNNTDVIKESLEIVGSGKIYYVDA